jgi:hypothetical protein
VYLGTPKATQVFPIIGIGCRESLVLVWMGKGKERFEHQGNAVFIEHIDPNVNPPVCVFPIGLGFFLGGFGPFSPNIKM